MIRQNSFQWHWALAWVAAFALLAFCVSAMTHPLLAWTGPQSSVFTPPQAVMRAEQVNAIRTILTKHNIDKATVVKLSPSERGVVLQVTEHNDQPRRYFDLSSHAELTDFDFQQAVWLARYYALNSDNTVGIKRVEFQREFDDAYPWVNRLLPVYKVTFDNDQRLTAYVYTEINALAGLSNTYKVRVQRVFQVLHTWSWLNQFDNARIIIMACVVLCVITMILTGIALVFLLKKRKGMSRKAVLHRALAYVLWLPLLGFSISGFFHLLHAGYSDVHSGLKLGMPISLSDLGNAPPVSNLPTIALNQISMVNYEGELFYRLSVPAIPPTGNDKAVSQTEHAHHARLSAQQRELRFSGQATEQGSHYYSVTTGQRSDINDQLVASAIAVKQLDLSLAQVTNTQLVTRFGLHYDFRNKRLPVWQINFDSESGDIVFIDPATGILVDHLVNLDRYEGYSFSFLHKWSFLTPLTGRQWRDVIVMIVLILTLVLTALGLSMRLRR